MRMTSLPLGHPVHKQRHLGRRVGSQRAPNFLENYDTPTRIHCCPVDPFIRLLLDTFGRSNLQVVVVPPPIDSPFFILQAVARECRPAVIMKRRRLRRSEKVAIRPVCLCLPKQQPKKKTKTMKQSMKRNSIPSTIHLPIQDGVAPLFIGKSISSPFPSFSLCSME